MTEGYENETKALKSEDIESVDAISVSGCGSGESGSAEYAAESEDKNVVSPDLSDFKTAHDRIRSDFESKESLEDREADELSDSGDTYDVDSIDEAESPVGVAPESFESGSSAEIGADLKPSEAESAEAPDSDAIEVAEISGDGEASGAESELSDKSTDLCTDEENPETTGELKAAESESETEGKSVTEADSSPDEKLEEQFKQVMFSNLVSKIDYDCTLPTITSAEIADEAAKAVEFGFGSVCILSSRMKTFKKQSKTQRFCAVIAYPSGEMTEKSKICEIKEATFGGAAEIDVFFRISALKDEKRRLIVRSLVKYGKVIGRKRIYKLSIDSTMVSKEEAQFIVQAAAEAKVDYLVVRNCDFSDTRTQLFYAKLCAGKCKLEFAHNVNDLSSMTKLTDIGTERFLLSNASEVALRLREELNDK